MATLIDYRTLAKAALTAYIHRPAYHSNLQNSLHLANTLSFCESPELSISLEFPNKLNFSKVREW